jgi:hypothetical protein
MECPIEDVPDFEHERNWHIALHEWLQGRGYDFNTSIDPPKGWQIAVGPNPRGTSESHAVVCWDGEPVWDPHPARTLFAGGPIKYFLVVLPVAELAARKAVA